MSKYIIKNCPNLTTSHYGTGETIHNQCGLTDDDLCINCTNCVMKQIVEKCRVARKEYPRCSPDGELDMFVSGRNNLAGNILALLDIGEIE